FPPARPTRPASRTVTQSGCLVCDASKAERPRSMSSDSAIIVEGSVQRAAAWRQRSGDSPEHLTGRPTGKLAGFQSGGLFGDIATWARAIKDVGSRLNDQSGYPMLRTACAAFLLTVAVAAAQTAYPTRTVTLVVVTAPGGGTDITARELAEGLSR